MSGGNGVVGLMGLAFVGWLIFGGDDGDHSTSNAVAPEPTVQVVNANLPKPRWSDDRICGYAIQTYFFVAMPPRIIDWKGNSLLFRTDAGNEYWCTIRDDRAVFEWLSDAGASMFSQSTVFSVLPDGRLLINSDMQDLTFTN